jgi:serine/threonine-protein kinase
MDPLQLQPSWLSPQHPREGRYVLGPLLGKGGMGEVVEAWDVILCRTVALKLLKEVDPTAMVQVMHEAQVQARIVHPNICRIYDVECIGSTVRIAMQLIKGPNLHQLAKDLSVPEAVAIIAQVAEAVHVAHLMKLIHRDIKPSNILLDQGPDGRMTPCLCDFGLAMSLAEPALSASQALAGTPGYMAPEQIRGERDRICPGTDIYALGGTLHSALLGHPPQLQEDSRPGPLTPSLPRDLQLIIRKCLEPQPEFRYASASALAEDLRGFLNGEPVQAQPMGTLARLARQGRKHARAVLAVAVASAVLALGGTALGRYYLRNRHAAQAAARRFSLETWEWERDLAHQHALPGHDMRPVNTLAQDREARTLADLATLGPAYQGPGHFAVGRIHFQLGEFALACQELETGWRLGQRGGAEARDLALARVFAAWAEGGAPPGRDLAKALLPRADGTALAGALRAYAGKDYLRAATEAGRYRDAHPWHRESALLETVCLCALAGERLEAGDPPQAEARFRDALQPIQAYLGPEGAGASDPAGHHAYFLTARRLAELQLGEGTLTEAFLNDLLQRCDHALTLDPGHPGLQEDWLDLHLLAARRLGDLGQDRFPPLDAAMVFLGSRVQEPLAPGLQAERMAIYWQLAEQRLAQRGDAAGALAEALTGSESPALAGDIRLAEALNCKARVEAAQGLDPRPTLAAALGRLEPLLQGGPRWPQCTVDAEAWLIRAEWEQGHGLDPKDSLQEASTRVDRALRAWPFDPRGNALQGLVCVLEMRAAPARRPELLLTARERLRQCLAMAAPGTLAQRLRQSLQEFP